LYRLKVRSHRRCEFNHFTETDFALFSPTASVAHQEVASVTAFVLLLAEIGGAVGTAIASAVWRQHMPIELANRLTGLIPDANITLIYGSIVSMLPAIFDSSH